MPACISRKPTSARSRTVCCATSLARILPYPKRMRAALQLARLGKPFSFLFAGESMFAKRLRAMLNLAPAQMAEAQSLGGTLHKAIGPAKGRVVLLAGCAQQAIAPSINTATISLLNRLGIESSSPPVLAAAARWCTIWAGMRKRLMPPGATSPPGWRRRGPTGWMRSSSTPPAAAR